MAERFIQIGVTALRDPVTGDFLPAVPLYIREEDQGKTTAAFPQDETALAKALGDKMKEYLDGCKAAGVEV